jgi:DNA-binding beta-propeller fold protein YncE
MKYLALALALTGTVSLAYYEYEGEWGSYGSGPGEFYRPYDIAVWSYYGVPYQHKVFVTDWNDRVQVFSAAGDYLYEWGSSGSGAGQFDHPRGIDVAKLSTFVYVVDSHNHRIQYFTNNGSYMGQWGSQGTGNYKFYYPWDVAVHPGNNNVYVTDNHNQKVKYYTGSGSFLGKWGGFLSPNGISVDEAGYVYVVASCETGHPLYPVGYSRVKKFTSTGSYITEWGDWGWGFGCFEYGMCCDESDDGRLYVPGERSDYVVYYSTNGNPIGRFGEGWLNGPTGCGFQHGGRVFVADNYHHRVVYFLDDVGGPGDGIDNVSVRPESFGKIKAMYK